MKDILNSRLQYVIIEFVADNERTIRTHQLGVITSVVVDIDILIYLFQELNTL